MRKLSLIISVLILCSGFVASASEFCPPQADNAERLEISDGTMHGIRDNVFFCGPARAFLGYPFKQVVLMLVGDCANIEVDGKMFYAVCLESK